MTSGLVFWMWFAGLAYLLIALISVRKDLSPKVANLPVLGRVFVPAGLALFGAEHLAAAKALAQFVRRRSRPHREQTSPTRHNVARNRPNADGGFPLPPNPRGRPAEGARRGAELHRRHHAVCRNSPPRGRSNAESNCTQVVVLIPFLRKLITDKAEKAPVELPTSVVPVA